MARNHLYQACNKKLFADAKRGKQIKFAAQQKAATQLFTRSPQFNKRWA
jgi:hypothetical protein